MGLVTSEAREITEAWMEEYNAIRPHESLQGLPPYSFVEKNMWKSPLPSGTKFGMLTLPHLNIS